MKGFGFWVFKVENKHSDYMPKLYNTLKNNIKDILIPTLVSVQIKANIINKKIKDWEELDNIILKEKSGIEGFDLEDVKFKLKNIPKNVSRTDILYIYSGLVEAYNDMPPFCYLCISTHNSIWLKNTLAKELEKALRGMSKDLEVEPEFETERSDIVTAWKYGIRPKR